MVETVMEILEGIRSDIRRAEKENARKNAEMEGLRELLRECRHALTAYQGLWGHDGDPAHAFQLNDADLIRRVDTSLG